MMLLVAGGVGAFLFLRKPAKPMDKTPQALADGRSQMLADTDEGFRRAGMLYEQARGAMGESAKVLAALGELKALEAFYLREDAHAADLGGSATASLAKTLRREAQTRVDEGKKHAADALALEPEGVEANRAMSEVLRVDGGPAAEVERYLKRALDKAPSDPETVFASGALAWREGKIEVARAKLQQAVQLSQAASQKPLARALYLLGLLEMKAPGAGQRDSARQHLSALVAMSPGHERAKALLAQVESAPDLAAPADLAPAAVPPVAGKTAPPPPSGEGETPAPSGDYNKMIVQANRMSENGKVDAAKKLYEKALQANPNGVEALTGLGYCELDKERFLSAVDYFKHALAVSPEYGDALIGLAESYKVRGEKSQASEYYRRYLKAQPSGPRAAMAQKNLRELEPRGAAAPREEKKEGEPKPNQEEQALPKPPPTVDEPPPP
jgi:tetratricopeptide (TPR) repeat protein